MLIEFAIDPSALLPLAGQPLWQTTEAHKRCIRYGLRYGILIHSGSDIENSDIWNAVQQLPQQLKTLWQKSLKIMRKRKGPTGWLGLGNETTLAGIQNISADVRVACLEEVRAILVGMPDTECVYEVQPNGPEIVRLSSIDHARSFKEAESLSNQPIPEGLDATELWKFRFRDIAVVSRHISIVDRYSVERLASGYYGLRRVLKEIDGAASGIKVRIYAALVDSSSDVLENAIKDIPLGRGGIREIEVILVPDYEFQRQAHDRFLRFDDAVFEIGIGVEVFDDSNVRRQSHFSFKMQDKLHTDTERKLQEKARHIFRHSPRRCPVPAIS